MSAPKYAIYPGLGEWAKENLHYSQAVRIGNTIKISGQGQINSHLQASQPPN
jgi:enamine deaminase RidA (YjgF/YER057c/UK114 family)